MKSGVLALLALSLAVLGFGATWVGIDIAYRAIDPDAYRDSAKSTYLIMGSGFLLIGLTLVVAAAAVGLQAFGCRVAWPVTGFIAVLGLVPYPVLLGAPAILINLLLLGAAALVFASARWKDSVLHSDNKTTPVE